MAKTFAEIRSLIGTRFPDNTAEEISEKDFRDMFADLADKVEESRWGYIKATLDNAETFQAAVLNGKEKDRLIIMIGATVWSNTDDFENRANAFSSGTGTLAFLGPTSGKMEILIRPKTT